MAERTTSKAARTWRRWGIALAVVAVAGTGALSPVAARAADPSADLSVSVTHTPASATAPAGVTFTVAARNDGPDAAQGVVAALGFDYPLEMQTVPAGCRRASNYDSVLCELGTVASGATVTKDITLFARGSGLFTVPVAIASDTPDPDAADRVTNDTVLVKAGPSQAVRYIRGIFPMIMERNPDSATVDYWAARWQAENRRYPRNLQRVPAGIMASNEYRRLRIRESYQRILGRAADPASLTSWVAKAADGMAYETIERRLITSNEFARKSGTIEELIASTYQAVLGRQPSAAEAKAALQSSTRQSYAAFVLSLQRSTEGYDVIINDRYQAAVGTPPSALGRYVWQVRLRQGRTPESLFADLLVSYDVMKNYPYTEDDSTEFEMEYDVPVSRVQAALAAG